MSYSKEEAKIYRDTHKEKAKAYHKEYRLANKEKLRQQKQEYRKNNKKELQQKQKEKYIKNKDQICKKIKEYRENNKEEINRKRRIDRENNKEEINRKQREKSKINYEEKKKKRREKYIKNKHKISETRKKRHAERIKTDVNYKLSRLLRSRLVAVIKEGKGFKIGLSQELLGCDWQTVKEWLESQFVDGMSWDNHGVDGWHIDHKIPCSFFDMTNEYEQKQCFHYTNLQPLWAKDNIIKADKVAFQDLFE